MSKESHISKSSISAGAGTPNQTILRSIYGSLVVSCQAAKGDPFDDLDTLCRLAQSVLLGGAGGLRAEGAVRIAAFRRLTHLPIIGIVKAYDRNADVYITPTFADAQSVSDAGAEIIALECTLRRISEAEPWPRLIVRIHEELGRIVCADVATLDEAIEAEQCGADIVATTLRGYTADTRDVEGVDWDFLSQVLAAVKTPVILEGHVSSPVEVRRALDMGVHAVVVGSAITRPQTITARFVAATSKHSPKA
jgi:N-acylglucosamine-6-phosphate 2-epimerase